ncbi:MAG TPA: glycosyltransferase [Bryobacteraceae bacterium]|nr:glycosyltransferase [Bryobacteraceae bacterium]
MRICWIKAGGLVPPDFGGRIRSFQMVKELARRHDVTLVTYYPRQDRDPHPSLAPLFANLVLAPLDLPKSFSLAGACNYARLLFSEHAYSIQKYYRPELKRAVASLFQTEEFDAIVCDFIHPGGLLNWRGKTPIVLFAHNVEAEVWDRHRKVARSWIWKIASYLEWKALSRDERRYLRAADHVVAVSERNKQSFARHIDSSGISVIGTGVDSEYFIPAPGAEQPGHVAFTGAMDYAPNQDAIDWYARGILPLLRREYPDIVTWAVGRNPPASLRALERAIPNLHVTGQVDDIRPYLNRACVYIAPLRSGSGTRLKIFEAMASGKAIVSTSIGAEGLPVQHGDNILLAETPRDFAGQCLRLLCDPDLRRRLGSAARRLVEEKYSWARVVDGFEQILRSAVERRRGTPQAAAAS